MVTKLSLTNFRSYQDETFYLDPNITVVVGPNATGKTNLLEALYVLATTKSFRAKDFELINHTSDFFRIEGAVGDSKLALGYQFIDGAKAKRAQLDGAKQTLVQHLSHLQTVLFEPNDLLLILGSPERRRRYLDFILTQTQPEYLSILHRYKRVLGQRNRLLSDWQGQTDQLFAWNIKLTELATDIDTARRGVITYINSVACDVYGEIAGTKQDLQLAYIGSADSSDYGSDFLARLEAGLSRDIGAGFTTIGPHRDDFDIRFKGSDVTAVASRGEMRTIVLVLKLAELSYIEEKTGRRPILLLDDVFSELDDSRREYLIGTLDRYQTVITTTDGDMAGRLGGSHVIETARFGAGGRGANGDDGVEAGNV